MTTYSGTYDGQYIESLYPNVYRVECRAFSSRRADLNVAENVQAFDEDHARQRIQKRYSDVRGAITVTHVATLDEDKS